MTEHTSNTKQAYYLDELDGVKMGSLLAGTFTNTQMGKTHKRGKHTIDKRGNTDRLRIGQNRTLYSTSPDPGVRGVGTGFDMRGGRE